MMAEDAGRVAIVTGAGTGIGAATARLLAERGMQVALVGRREETLRRVAEAVEDAGGTATVVVADLTRREAPREIVGAVLARFGRIDVLINNAATIKTGPFEQFTEEQFDEHVTVNIRSIFFLIQAALPALRESDAAAIV